MRPDEHKRKKSAQYRKKHGIAKAGGGGGGSKEPDTKKKAREVQQHQPVKALSADETDDTECGECDGKKSFRRRQIVSNWQQYEAILNEDPEQKGSDFTDLLSITTVDALSQFRFKDEKDWETGDGKAMDTDFLAIDCENLASSLLCVPLPDRLALDRSLFSNDQLKSFIEEAKANKKVYQPLKGSAVVKEKNVHSISTVAGGDEQLEAENLLINDRESKMMSNLNSHDQKEKQEKKVKVAKVPISKAVIQSQENELDALLSLNLSKSKGELFDEESVDTKSISNQVMGESVSSGKTDNDQSGTTTKGLEDWLDSILED